MTNTDILPYLEAIFGFCRRRVSNHHDAEDLAGEIVCHILAGMQRYEIRSLDAWVWRIARNRYARYVARQKKSAEMLSEEELYDLEDDYCALAEEEIEEKNQSIFHNLHTLSASYRDIFVDHYVGQLSVRALAEKYSLPETTIKWRLNAGRQKIRERIKENQMERIYKRLNWDTTACNGSMDSDRYLHTQAARAICEAAYETPMTVEEISLRTGLPALYIEDELPRLEYGDAVIREGSKYAANFIILRLKDQQAIEQAIAPMMEEITGHFANLFAVSGDFHREQYGQIIVTYLLRKRIQAVKDKHLSLVPFPPRQDGGYGWFIVQETADETENAAFYSAGCNIHGDETGHLYFYWLNPAFNDAIYHSLPDGGLPGKCPDGKIPSDLLSDEQLANLLAMNMAIREDGGYRLNFPLFTPEQFYSLVEPFRREDNALDEMISRLITEIRRSFREFVPHRLEDQIDQWVRCYASDLAGRILHELINRGILPAAPEDRPLTEGIFWISGEMLEV